MKTTQLSHMGLELIEDLHTYMYFLTPLISIALIGDQGAAGFHILVLLVEWTHHPQEFNPSPHLKGLYP